VDFENGELDKYANHKLDRHESPYFAPDEAEARAQEFEYNVAQELGVFGTREYPEEDTDRFISDFYGPMPVDSPVPPASKKSCTKR
jgi:hypothetical protein